MAAVTRVWMRSSASCHVMRSKRPSPLGPTRRSGVMSRPGPCTKSGYKVWTLVHSTPAVSGLAREPRTLTTRSSSTVTVRLQVSGQSRGQTLGFSAIMRPPGSCALYRDGWLGSSSTTVALSDPEAAGHEAGHEDDEHDQRHFHVIHEVEGARPRGVRCLPAAELRAPADEGGHGPYLEEHDGEEEGHLRPEQRGGEIELAPLFQPGEGPEEARDDPQRRRNAPNGVRGEKLSRPVAVQPCLEGPAAQVDGGQAEGQGQHVEGGDDGRYHLGHLVLLLRVGRERDAVAGPIGDPERARLALRHALEEIGGDPVDPPPQERGGGGGRHVERELVDDMGRQRDLVRGGELAAAPGLRVAGG